MSWSSTPNRAARRPVRLSHCRVWCWPRRLRAMVRPVQKCRRRCAADGRRSGGGGGPAGHADDAQHQHSGEGLVPVLRVAPGQSGGQGRRPAGVDVRPANAARPAPTTAATSRRRPSARPAAWPADPPPGSALAAAATTPSASPGRRARPRSRRRPPRTRRARRRRPARRAPCTGSRGRAPPAGPAPRPRRASSRRTGGCGHESRRGDVLRRGREWIAGYAMVGRRTIGSRSLDNGRPNWHYAPAVVEQPPVQDVTFTLRVGTAR